MNDQAIGRVRPAPLPASDVRSRYRRALLSSIGLASISTSGGNDEHPACAWAASGAMALTGERNGPPLVAPAAVACCAGAVTDVLAALSPSPALAHVDGARLLGERAAVSGLQRGGTISAGGACRMLRCRDGWIAVNLPREEDLDLVGAWLQPATEVRGEVEPWSSIERELALRTTDDVVARGRLLGLAVADTGDVPDPEGWLKIVARGPAREHDGDARPLVVDLGALWAGPLCGHLLGLAGARVVKVESRYRPDGARNGPRAFYDLLNAGKESVALDFGSREGLRALHALLQRADIVIEASRPRALEQLGIDATSLVQRRPGLTWTSITGYGRRGPERDWIAFGDDAAAAAGLTATSDAAGAPARPMFCGDAIADPLAGLHAALGSLASWYLGGGRLLDICLRDVAAHVLRFAPMPGNHRVEHDERGWYVACGEEQRRVETPQARQVSARAADLGTHTDAVLSELAAAC